MIKHCLGITEINSIPAKLKKFSTLKYSPFPLTQSTKVHRRALVLLHCLIPCLRCENSHHFDRATWQHTPENPRHVRGLARIYDVRMAQFVLKTEKLSHIMAPRGTQGLPSLSPIMAPGYRREQRFPRQNPPKKKESPHLKEAKESKLRSLALQQKKTREQGYSKTQTPYRESTVSPDPCSDSKLILSSDGRVK